MKTMGDVRCTRQRRRQHITVGSSSSRDHSLQRSLLEATSEFTKPIILISIKLCPINDHTTTTSSNKADHNDIATNALLRACVKRLLVGNTIVSLFDTYLSVKVPKTSFDASSSSEKYTVLKFHVTNIQSSEDGQSELLVSSNEQQLPVTYIIIPSTRILFQPNNNVNDDTEDQYTQQQTACPSMDSIMPPSSSLPAAAHLPATQIMISPPPHEHLVESLRSILFFHSQSSLSLPIPRAFLFSGPPGVGKTYSVKRAIDIVNSWPISSNKRKATVHLISLRGSELLGTASSSNHATAARELERQFDLAVNMLCKDNGEGENSSTTAVVIFLDECDALVSSSTIISAMLANLLDMMETTNSCTTATATTTATALYSKLIVVAATNRVDAIPDYLRRPGRLEKEVVVSPPNVEERLVLLKSMLDGSAAITERGRNNSSSLVGINDVDLQKVAEACVGYVAADLSALVRKAAALAIEERFHGSSSSSQQPHTVHDHPTITTKHLISAMKDVGASCLRDAALSAPPKTTWDDIAGDAGGAKRALREAIEWPRTRKDAFTALGLSPPRGVLLHGPPGCAKTTLARAAAGAAGVAFLSLSPADVYASSYVGEAEGIVRRAFDLARSAAPCVLFFDEIDAIIGGEDETGGGHGMGRGSSAEARVLSTFLNEMDGVESVVDGVLVLGATNRPRLLDAALLRPGRFDRVIYVPPPDKLGRKAILSMECQKWYNALLSDSGADNGIETYFDVDVLASEEISGSMTGAEIVGACRETAVQVMQNFISLTDGTFGAEKCLQSLMNTLKDILIVKQPLLSTRHVLEEYTRFERERN